MAKTLESILAGFVDDCRKVWPDDIVSLTVYGSAARGGYVPGRSDINTLLVLKKADPETISRAMGNVKSWRRQGLAVPLFMTPEGMEASIDVFPVEYLNMKLFYRVLDGRDVLAGIKIDPADVRRECEREFRGKLILLRQAFFSTGGAGREMQELVNGTLGAFHALFRALLHLHQPQVPPENGEVVRQLAGHLGFQAAPFLVLEDVKKGRVKKSTAEIQVLLKDYVTAVAGLAGLVDAMNTEGMQKNCNGGDKS